MDPSWMIWGRGFDFPIFPDFRCPEPSATSIERKDDKGQPIRDLLKASHARGIWRQLAALVVKRRAGSVGGALAMENVPDDKGFDIHVCALLRNQATIEAFQESIFHIPAGMTTDIGRKIYEGEVNLAEAKARKLGRAVEKWRREMDPDWEQKLNVAGKDKNKLRERLRSIATNHFWTAIEKNLPLLIAYTSSLEEDNIDEREKKWRRAVSRSARASYELACGRESPRQLRAFAMGLRILEREEIPDTEKQEE
jgi:CRISPR system Cascade subunit CasA